jgi:WD40 repeat protein
MAKPAQKRKRRGVVLSPLGWQRLQEAQEQLAIAANGGYAYTLEQLSELANLSVRSISRLQGCNVAVDRQTLEEFFRAFKLALNEQDYLLPEAVLERSPLLKAAIAPDWGEAPDVSRFYGRNHELVTLSQWVVQDNRRLIALLGIGGIGKTVLSLKLAEQLQNQFTHVIWRSLRNAPPLETLLAELVPFLSDQQETQADVSTLLQCLQNTRCLVILDNSETLLQTGSQSGQYRPGYEAYNDLLRVVAEARHQSCLVLTSREKCAQVAQLERDAAVEVLSLDGSAEVAELLIANVELTGTAEQKRELGDRYLWNPLALKIVATSIHDLFDGDIGLFLQQDTLMFNGLRRLLDQQFERLSPLEQTILYWLAINREWTTIAELAADLLPTISRASLLESLESLSRRSLLERKAGEYTQQPVVMEYATEKLIERVGEEILELNLSSASLLQNHALLKVQDKDYIQDSQTRVILMPLIAKLRNQLGSEKDVIYQLNQVLSHLKAESCHQSGYAGGNLINLLRSLQVDLRGYDFSYLSIWQADLQNLHLPQVNLAHANLSKSRFTQIFSSVSTVAFSPDDRLLAIGDANQQLSLWRVSDGQTHAVFSDNPTWVWAVAWSPDGRILASGGEDHFVRLWDVASKRCVAILRGHQGTVRDLAWHPQEPILASCGDDHQIRFWDLETNECNMVLSGHQNWVMSIAWNPDGNLLVSGSLDRTVRLWDKSIGKCLQTFAEHTDGIWAVGWNSTGNLIATGSADHTIKIWNNSGECLRTLQEDAAVYAIAWSSDGKLASGGVAQNITLWDAESGQCLQTLPGHSSWVWAIAWSTDNKVLASCGHDQAVRLWQRCGSVPYQRFKTFQGYNNAVFAVAWSPGGGILASSSADRQVYLWNSATGLCLKTLQGHSNWTWGLAWSPDGTTIATASDDRTVRLWDSGTGECRAILQGHTSWVWTVAWSPDCRRLASGSGDLTIRIWDTQTGECLNVLQGHQNWIWNVDWNPDGMTIASASDDFTVRLWNPDSGECLQVLEGHDDWVESNAWSPDGKLLASGSFDRTLRVWDGNTCLHVLRHPDIVRGIAWSSDGQQLASACHDRTIRIWNVQTGTCVQTLEGHDGQVWTVAWRSGDSNPETSILASSGADETIKLWHVHTGECFRTIRADRPYEGMNITHLTGVTEAQKVTLQMLGAIVDLN